ncbi:hypothetical protein [Bradyrhizobium sp. dw_78]|uniref:hypothetical protein n=1 Tax=Bradyrhizobium sp. dw_78 TaxID=2719793 RepID=UPI001BD3769A|nr:hypothetical protein [Bradyrhizobium sp. dw_78]
MSYLALWKEPLDTLPVLPISILPGPIMKQPWYIQAIFGTVSFVCFALLTIAPFAPSKADKALMGFIAIAAFIAAGFGLSIFNRIKYGTVFPGLKRVAGATDKAEVNRLTTILGLLIIMFLSLGAIKLADYKQLSSLTEIPFGLMLLGAIVGLICMRFRKQQQKDS